MANIKDFLNKIKTAIYGEEVRGAIHDSIKNINDEVEEVSDNVGTKEPKIPSGTTSQYIRGNKTLYDFATSVRSSVLTGLSLATDAAISVSDTVLSAFGKLQTQITNHKKSIASTSQTGHIGLQSTSGLEMDSNGLMRVSTDEAYGTTVTRGGKISIIPATHDDVKIGIDDYRPLTPDSLRYILDRFGESMSQFGKIQGAKNLSEFYRSNNRWDFSSLEANKSYLIYADGIQDNAEQEHPIPPIFVGGDDGFYYNDEAEYACTTPKTLCIGCTYTFIVRKHVERADTSYTDGEIEMYPAIETTATVEKDSFPTRTVFELPTDRSVLSNSNVGGYIYRIPNFTDSVRNMEEFCNGPGFDFRKLTAGSDYLVFIPCGVIEKDMGYYEDGEVFLSKGGKLHSAIHDEAYYQVRDDNQEPVTLYAGRTYRLTKKQDPYREDVGYDDGLIEVQEVSDGIYKTDKPEYQNYVYCDGRFYEIADQDVRIVADSDGNFYVHTTDGWQSIYDFISAINPISALNHRNIYRGKNLGTSITDAQKKAISSGTFDDLFIGDYWTIDGTRYDIADMDYWYNVGDTAFTKHHLVLIPHSSLYSAKMNDTNTTQGGYIGSKMYTEYLEDARTKISNAFGDMLLTHRNYFTNAVKDGKASGAAWVDSTVDLMNEIMVCGSHIHAQEQSVATADKMQLAIFRLNPNNLHTRTTLWLRNVVSAANFAVVYSNGIAATGSASTSPGVRPVFAIG